MNDEFIDYYEILECSPKANSETIERLFRYFAKRLHPDVAESGNIHKFTALVEAYETLKDPKTRAGYDVEFAQQTKQHSSLVEDAGCVDSDSVQRHKILSLMYAKRRQNMRDPGIASTTLERLADCPREVMDFHLWYFREKGWILREESGSLSISAAGVDKIEATLELKATTSSRRLTVEKDRVEAKSNATQPMSPATV